jgi:site-specific recombinase XerD
VQIPAGACTSYRHAFATNCYYRGRDIKILSKLLGRADVNITYNPCIHLSGDALDEMKAVIG